MVKMATAPKFVSDGKGGIKKSGEAPKPKVVEKPKTAAPKPEAHKPKEKPKTEAQPTSGKKLTYEARMRQLPQIERIRRKLASTILRFENLHEELVTWKNAADLNNEAKTVRGALDEMLDVAKSMPDDFKPERDRKARESHLQPGVKVTIREKVAESYEGVIETDAELEVLDIRKGRVVCKTAEGEKVFIPRGHLRVVDGEEDDEDDGEGE